MAEMHHGATGAALLLALAACDVAPMVPATRAAAPAPSATPVASAVTSEVVRRARPSGPAVIAINPSEVDIDIHGAYLVDVQGVYGTRRLWPHPNDCPSEPESDPSSQNKRVSKGGGDFVVPLTRIYRLDSCAPEGPPPAGDYLLRLDSGYADSFYAVANLRLPLTETVEMRFAQHDRAPPCDSVRAQRAAWLVLRGNWGDRLIPPGFLDGCAADTATCGGPSAAPPTLPPERCSMTLHGDILRLDKPAGDDAPRWLTAWFDQEIVYSRSPDTTRTSASRVVVDGKAVVVAGSTTHEMHEHGGAAARVGGVQFTAHNPHSKPLPLRVDGVAFLTDSSCAPPSAVTARPRVQRVEPDALPPGTSSISVAFEAQSAYQAHCDRFATRLSLRIAGQPVAVTVEHEVTRIEPLRNDDF